MKRAQQFPGRTLRNRVGLRWVSSSPFPLPIEAATVRTKGYGPTKDLLKGVDTTNGLVVETVMHPADAEMQRRVLSLSSPDVSVYTPLDVETATEESSVPVQREDIVAIAPDQLSSVATVIVDQLKEHLELTSYASEASHDGRSGSIVNAIATCLRQEIDRVVLETHTQEASFSRMLQESSDVICARIASVIHEERPQYQVKDAEKDNQHYSLLLQEVKLSMNKLEQSLKEAFEASITANQGKDPVPEDLRGQIVTAIEQATRMQQEHISVSLEDILEKKLISQGSLPPAPPTLEEIEGVVKTAMTRIMDDTQSEVRELMQTLREKSSAESTVSPSKGEIALEGLLASYGERLEEMRETTSGFSDLKELLMEVHSHQQTNMTAIHDVETQVKKLKKELMSALHELAEDSSKSAKIEEKDDRFGEYCDKLDALADRVTSRVEEQLKQQHEDIKDLPKRLIELENVIRERKQPVVDHVPLPQEFDDDRMVTLAQSISDSILAGLAQREELSQKAVKPESPSLPPPPPPPQPQPVPISVPVPQFTKDELAEAVSAVLHPKLDEIAATMESAHKTNILPSQLEESPTLITDEQLLTVAQTISDSLRDVVKDMITTNNNNTTTTTTTNDTTKSTDVTHIEESKEAILERLGELKQSIIATVQEEMGRTHEIDLTPFQNYLDEVIHGMKEEWNKKQEVTEDKIKAVVESLVTRLQDQHEQEQHQQRERREQQEQQEREEREEKQMLKKDIQELRKSNDEILSNSFTMEKMTSITDRLLAEMKSFVDGETASVSSSLNTVRDEFREVTQQSSENLSKKLSSIEASLNESRVMEQDNDLRVRTALEGVTASLESVKEGNNSAAQTLSSINSAVADMVHKGATTASEMKAQLMASEERVGNLHTQLTTELSERFNQLHTEVLDGRRRIDELLSSSADHKGMTTSVEAMRVKLDTVGQMLEDIAALKATPTTPPPPPSPPQTTTQEENEKHVMDAITIEPRLDSLSAATQEILSELQKLRLSHETLQSPSAPESPPTLQQEQQQQQTFSDLGVTKENLEEMEGRLSERLDAVQSTLNSLKEMEASAALPLDETPEQVPVTEDGKDRLAEMDAIIKLASVSRGVHAKQIRERLIALRSFVATAKLEKAEGRDMEEVLKVLESNRLKLKEDMVDVESELVEKVNEKIQQMQDSLLLSLKQTTASSTESHVRQLQNDLDTKSNELKSHQEQLVIKLLDRINELEKSQGVNSAEMTEEMRKNHKEWNDTLHHVIQQDVPSALRGTVGELFADQFHTVKHQLIEQKTQEEKSSATLLSSIQQVSRDVSQLNDLGGQVRAAVSGSSTQVIEELHRTNEGLAERIERHVSEVVRQQGTSDVQPSVSYVSVTETAVAPTPSTPAAVVYSAPLSIWWLLVLSFVVITTIMAGAYFLWAIVLVTFVPVPPPEELLLTTSTAPTPQNTPAQRPKRSRVVDEVIQ